MKRRTAFTCRYRARLCGGSGAPAHGGPRCERLVEQLKARAIYIRVIDVTELPLVHEPEWSAIVIVHTWENWRPQKDAASFVERAREKGRLVVVTTSGSGREKMPGVDVISAASELRDVDAAASQVTARLDAVLQLAFATTR